MGPGKVAAAVRSDLGLDCRRLALALPELLAAALSVREVKESSAAAAARRKKLLLLVAEERRAAGVDGGMDLECLWCNRKGVDTGEESQARVHGARVDTFF